MTDTEHQTEHLELHNGWHLITHGQAQISIAPDGLIMFPRHCTPSEIDDLLVVLGTAATIGAQIQADNQAKANTPSKPTPAGLIITEGPPPPGATRLPYSSIGRTKTRGGTP